MNNFGDTKISQPHENGEFPSRIGGGGYPAHLHHTAAVPDAHMRTVSRGRWPGPRELFRATCPSIFRSRSSRRRSPTRKPTRNPIAKTFVIRLIQVRHWAFMGDFPFFAGISPKHCCCSLQRMRLRESRFVLLHSFDLK